MNQTNTISVSGIGHYAVKYYCANWHSKMAEIPFKASTVTSRSINGTCHVGYVHHICFVVQAPSTSRATLLGANSHSQNLSASLKRRDADTRPRFVVSRYIDTRRIVGLNT